MTQRADSTTSDSTTNQGEPKPMDAGDDPVTGPGGLRRQGGVPFPVAAPVVAAVSSVIAAIAVLVATLPGPGLTADSLSYYSTGLNWAEGRGLHTFSGMPLTMFPPAVPGVIAVGHWLGLGPEWTMRLLNIGAAVGIVLLGHHLARRYIRTPIVLAATTVLLAVNVALLDLAKMALSECLFVFISLGFLAVAQQVIDHGDESSRSDEAIDRGDDRGAGARWHLPAFLVALTVLVWVGFGVRYAGVVLVPVGILAVFAGYRYRSVVVRLVAAGAYAVLAMVGPALIMVRNRGVDGTLMGPRTPSSDGLAETVVRFVAITGKWLLPDPTPTAFQAGAGLGLLAMAVSLAIAVLQDPVRRASVRQSYLWSPLVSFSIIYSAYIIVAQTMVAFDKLNSRLMSPLIVPFLILGATAIDRALTVRPDRLLNPSVRRTGAIIVAVLMVYQAGCFSFDVSRSGRDGVDYAAREWQSSELFKSTREVPGSATLYSNAPAGAYAVLHRQPILKSPAKQGRRSGLKMSMPEDFLNDVRCADTYLAWSDGADSGYLFSPQELSDFVEVDVVAASSDGTLYKLAPSTKDQSQAQDTGC